LAEEYPLMKQRAILVAAVLAVAACSGGVSDAGGDTTGVPSPTTSLQAQISSTTVPEAAATTTTSLPGTTTEGPSDDVLQDLGLVYLSDAERDWTLGVYYPAGEGPWPLIVIVPPQQSVAYAGYELASRGAVVVVADAWSTASFTDVYAIFSGELDRAACIVGWAQAHAADYGADAERTVVDGYSGGAMAAAWVGLGLADDAGCVDPITSLPIGLVVGESQVLFHHERWDPPFTSEDPGAFTTLDGLINPDRWTVSPDLKVALWSAANPIGETRSVENPPGPDSWIRLRDAASPCVEDLMEVGAFEDGRIDWSDNARLMESRMAGAGIDVRNKTYGISHRYTTEVYDLIFSILP
jgi:hypothetical protein